MLQRTACRLCASASHHNVRRPLVLGGAGQLGRHMVRLLREQPGCERVKVLDVRPPTDGYAHDVPIEFTNITLGTDTEDSLRAAIEGSDCIFTMVTPDVQHAIEAVFHATNHKGIEQLIQASKIAGVPRLVHISSIATTNHFIESVDASENDPLPPISEYISPYDISKRLGEEAVLAANGDALATVSLRAGGILAGPRDFTFRSMFERPGQCVTMAGTKPIDFIYAPDLCRAALLAAERLGGGGTGKGGVAGEVFNVTKGEAIRSHELAARCATRLGWQLTLIPEGPQTLIRAGFRIKRGLQEMLGGTVSGIPMADYMRIPLFEQTFDNSKVREELGFVTEVSIDDAIERIIDEYLATAPHSK